MDGFLPWSRLAVIALLAISLMGCSEAPTPPQVEEPPPSADSPQTALRLLEQSWNQRDLPLYTTLLSDDFVFAFAALDPYGNAYRENPWTREDDLISTRNLFYGSADRAAPVEITLTLDRNFIVQPDPRPGNDPRWHKFVRSGLTLSIVEADQVRRDVTGSTVFYVVRGDSAIIPPDLRERGITPDSTLWFVERWEDESAGGEIQAIKALYR